MAKSRSKPENIDAILKQWPYDPEAISVRLVRASGDRDVVQMRIELGVLQLETDGRPDGSRPLGAATVLDYLREAHAAHDASYTMDENECAEADREFVQFYHRRICWLALRDFRRAVNDADHTLQLMDACRASSPDDGWTATHEQYRPFVLFHRTQAAALSALDDDSAEAAVETVNDGLRRIHDVYESTGSDGPFEDDELVQRLMELRESLREQFSVGRTLREQLADAVAAEHYELAAKIRDELARGEFPPHTGRASR